MANKRVADQDGRKPPTLVELLDARFRGGGDASPAMLLRRSTLRKAACDSTSSGASASVPSYFSVSWEELRRDVLRLAAVLQATGVQSGTPVIQVAENSYEWIVLDLAIHGVRAVHVPVHASLTGAQIAFQIRHSEACHVFLSGEEQAAKLREYLQRTPAAAGDSHWRTIHWYCYQACESPDTERPAQITRVAEAVGQANVEEGARALEQARAKTQSEDLATILYTSGTTGEPKGVMLTQGNLAHNALATLEALPPHPDELRLCFLPLSHIFARTCDLYTWLAAGVASYTERDARTSETGSADDASHRPNVVLALAESRDTVLRDLAAVRPTMISGVPYFYGKLAQAVEGAGQADTPGSLQHLLGGRIRLCASGGAALPTHTYEFFHRQGVPLLQGYGLTETSPVISVSTLENVKADASGKPIRDVEVRISEDGEILTRGPHVMRGYFKDPEATAAVIRDGWFHTGDLGYFDEEGFLFVTGRSKEVIVTAGGKNISPVFLESLLTQDPLIAQAMVLGDDRKFLTALIVPDPDELRRQIIERGIPVTSASGALGHAEVHGLFEERIRAALTDVSHYEQVQKFHLMDRGFTIESGELTAKLTLRRDAILANCRDLIDAMYEDG